MTYDAREGSVHDGEPIELYQFSTPVRDYLYTSFTEDVTVGSDTYIAIQIKRSAAKGSTQENAPEMTIEMPVDVDLIQDIGFGIAPRQIQVTIFRKHLTDAQTITYWKGKITAVAVKGRRATLQIPSKFKAALNTTIPSIVVQGMCNHVWADSRCSVVEADFQVDTVAETINTTTVEVASVGANPNDWFKGGRIVRDTDGEQRLIVAQVGTVLTLNYPFRELLEDDAVTIFAGCDHLPSTCRDKFANVINGGFDPFVPTTNVFETGIK